MDAEVDRRPQWQIERILNALIGEDRARPVPLCYERPDRAGSGHASDAKVNA